MSAAHNSVRNLSGEDSGWHVDPSGGGLFLLVAMIAGVVCRTALRNFRRRFNLPYTVVVLAAGSLYALVAHSVDLRALSDSMDTWIDINPHHLLFIFFPALIFSFAFQVSFHVFLREAPLIFTLAAPGVFLATVMTAVIVVRLFPYEWDYTTAMCFGAMLSATDPVSVVSVLRSMNVAPRLGHCVEGESLVNDGTAMVLFVVFRDAMAEGTTVNTGEFLGELARLSLGGVFLGLLVGGCTVFVVARIAHDTMAELAVTIVAAYCAFSIAEVLPPGYNASGVLSLVTLGLVLASTEAKASLSRISYVEKFWHTAEYLANTVIFFLSGAIIVVNSEHVSAQDWLYLFILYFFLHLIRGAVVLLSWCFMHIFFPKSNVAGPEAAILGFAGLRGAVGLTLAMSVLGDERIDSTTRHRFMFFMSGIALLTLVVNGTTAIYVLRCYRMTAEPGGLRRATIRIVGREVAKLIRQLRSVPRLRVDWEIVQEHTNLLFKCLLDTTRQHGKTDEKEVQRFEFIPASPSNVGGAVAGKHGKSGVGAGAVAGAVAGVAKDGTTSDEHGAGRDVGDAKPMNGGGHSSHVGHEGPPPPIAGRDRGFSALHEATFKGSSRSGGGGIDRDVARYGGGVHGDSVGSSWRSGARAPRLPTIASPGEDEDEGFAPVTAPRSNVRPRPAPPLPTPPPSPTSPPPPSPSAEQNENEHRDAQAPPGEGGEVKPPPRPTRHSSNHSLTRGRRASSTKVVRVRSDPLIQHVHGGGYSTPPLPPSAAVLKEQASDASSPAGNRRRTKQDSFSLGRVLGYSGVKAHDLDWQLTYRAQDIVTPSDLAEARLEFLSLVRVEFWSARQHGYLSSLSLSALLLACDRSEDEIRRGLDRCKAEPLKLWGHFDSKPKALLCLPHSLVYRSGEVLRLQCCSRFCRPNAMLTYGSLLYQHEAAAGLTHVLTNALKRFREYGDRALHPSIMEAVAADVQEDIHASRVYVDDIDSNFPELVQSLSTRNIVRRIFFRALQTLKELQARGHLGEAEHAVMEHAIAEAERPIRMSRVVTRSELAPQALLRQEWAQFLFRGVSTATAQRVCDAARAHVFARGDAIFEPGSVNEGFYVLVKGRVCLKPVDSVPDLVLRMRRRSTIGSDVAAAETDDLYGYNRNIELQPGDVFGALSFISARMNVFRATCQTSVYTLYFERKDIYADLRSTVDPTSGEIIPTALECNVVARAASVVARIIPALSSVPILTLRSNVDVGRLVRPRSYVAQRAPACECLLLTGRTVVPTDAEVLERDAKRLEDDNLFAIPASPDLDVGRGADSSDSVDSNDDKAGDEETARSPSERRASVFIPNFAARRRRQEHRRESQMLEKFDDGVHAWALLPPADADTPPQYYSPGTRVLLVPGLHQLHQKADRRVARTTATDAILYEEVRTASSGGRHSMFAGGSAPHLSSRGGGGVRQRRASAPFASAAAQRRRGSFQIQRNRLGGGGGHGRLARLAMQHAMSARAIPQHQPMRQSVASMIPHAHPIGARRGPAPQRRDLGRSFSGASGHSMSTRPSPRADAVVAAPTMSGNAGGVGPPYGDTSRDIDGDGDGDDPGGDMQ